MLQCEKCGGRDIDFQEDPPACQECGRIQIQLNGQLTWDQLFSEVLNQFSRSGRPLSQFHAHFYGTSPAEPSRKHQDGEVSRLLQMLAEARSDLQNWTNWACGQAMKSDQPIGWGKTSTWDQARLQETMRAELTRLIDRAISSHGRVEQHSQAEIDARVAEVRGNFEGQLRDKDTILRQKEEEIAALRAILAERSPLEDIGPGVEWIAAERVRQIREKSFDVRHDDQLREADLARASATYAAPNRALLRDGVGCCTVRMWPWEEKESPDTRTALGVERMRQLAKAGALAAAELDRLWRQNNLQRCRDASGYARAPEGGSGDAREKDQIQEGNIAADTQA